MRSLIRMPLICNLVLLVFLLGTRYGFSQSDSLNGIGEINSLQPGSYALQFSIDENFTLDDFQGTLLSIKKQFSRNSAIRLGISLSTQFTDDNSDQKSLTADTLSTKDWQNRETNFYSIRVNSQYIYYTDPQANMNVYFGTGPIFGYSYLKSEGDQKSTDLTDTTTFRITNTNRSWSIGLSGLLGVEWFFRINMSLFAEYGLQISYIDNHIEQTQHRFSTLIAESQRITTENKNQIELRSQSVRFGLSVYF